MPFLSLFLNKFHRLLLAVVLNVGLIAVVEAAVRPPELQVSFHKNTGGTRQALWSFCCSSTVTEVRRNTPLPKADNKSSHQIGRVGVFSVRYLCGSGCWVEPAGRFWVEAEDTGCGLLCLVSDWSNSGLRHLVKGAPPLMAACGSCVLHVIYTWPACLSLQFGLILKSQQACLQLSKPMKKKKVRKKNIQT